MRTLAASKIMFIEMPLANRSRRVRNSVTEWLKLGSLENRSGKRIFDILGTRNNLCDVRRRLTYTSLSCCAAMLCIFLHIIEKPADRFLVVVVLLAFHDHLKGVNVIRLETEWRGA
jgi:hypothetical protein